MYLCLHCFPILGPAMRYEDGQTKLLLEISMNCVQSTRNVREYLFPLDSNNTILEKEETQVYQEDFLFQGKDTVFKENLN